MKTNAHNYNEALRDTARYNAVSLEAVRRFITAYEDDNLGIPHTEWINVDASYVPEMDLSYDYNSEVVDDTLAKLGLEGIERTKKILSSLVYNSRRYARAVKTLQLYASMEEKGYMSIHDITEDMHDKKAVLTGKQTHDWLTTTKNDEPVRLVALSDGRRGYKKPRMRTRFYQVPIDADLFVKVAS